MYIWIMQIITTTELRTKSKNLVKTLEGGLSVDLVHRSRLLGKIIPNDYDQIKTIDAEKLEKKIQALHFPKLTMKEIDRRYRAAMMKKHG